MRPLNRLTPLLLLLLLTPAAPAESGGEIMTRYDMDTGIGETVLANGMRVLTLERHGVPVVSSQIWYRVGSADEMPGESGLAHFLEHLMFKGTDRYAKGEIDRITLKLGGYNNAGTSNDYTQYYFNFASDRWETALEIEANRMRNLAFDPAEFEAERKVVIEELKLGRDGPWAELDETAEAVAFSAHPYRHPVIGWKTDLERIPRERVRAFYDRFYRPRNATLVLVGDFDTRRALARVAELFGDIPAGPDPAARRTEEPRQNGERRLVVRRDAELVRLEILYHATSARSPDDAVLDVIRSALVDGKSSRLGRRLVEEEGAVTFVDAANDSRRDPGIFWIYAEVQAGADPEAVTAAIHEETGLLAREGLTPDELSRAKKQLLVDLAFGRDTVEKAAEEIGYQATVADWRRVGTADRRIREVANADVMRVAGEVFRPGNRTVALALPERDEGGASSQPRRVPNRRRRTRRAGAGPTVELAPTVARLPNGLTLILARNDATPVLAVDAWVDAGRVREAVPGLARLTGASLLEGAAGLDAIRLDEELARLGAEVKTTGTGLTARSLAEDAGELIPRLADLLIRPDFPEDGIERARERTLNEIRADDDDPQRVARKAFDAAVYGAHPLGHPAAGTVESVAGITREQIEEHHRRWYVPEGAVISAVSSLPTDELLTLFEDAFGEWSGGDVPELDLPEIPEAVKRRIRIEREADQVNVYVGHRGIRRDDPDYYRLLVMDYVLGLGPGFTDRLSRTLRDRDGLAYTVYASITSTADRVPGTFYAFIGTSADQEGQAIEGILREIGRIREAPVDPEELDDAKAYLTGSFVFGYETAEQLARKLVDLHRLGLGFDYPARFAERIAAVTAEDVMRVAEKHLHPDALTIVTVGPR